MQRAIDEPRVFTRPLTSADKGILSFEELVDLLGRSRVEAAPVTLSTASETSTPTTFCTVLHSSQDPWFELALQEENLEPWNSLEDWQAPPLPVEFLTSGTKPTSTTVTAVRQLLRLYRDGKESRFERQVDIETLAAEQGVQPVSDLDQLRGDFWPEDEDVDEFIAQVRRWRRSENPEDDAQ